ncbi:hypothetical protein BGX29_007877 [Mortierella sp. GBA35]|nr:hypothetical protein BGX29_007877 [Mortierella sp. GBA35]
MVRFTDLPAELLDIIRDRLLALHGDHRIARRATFRRLILTCRSLHQHFTPQLWADIEVELLRKGRQPDAVAIKNHAHFIHTLKYYESLPLEYYNISFSNLVEFGCQGWLDRGRKGAERWDIEWARLIRLNSTIRNLNFGLSNPTDYQEIWDAIVTSLENPRRLVVNGTDVAAGVCSV